MLLEYTRRDFGYLLYEFDDSTRAQLWSLVTELLKRIEAWVRASQDAVTISWNDLTRVEGGPKIFFNLLGRGTVADRLLHGQDPA